MKALFRTHNLLEPLLSSTLASFLCFANARAGVVTSTADSGPGSLRGAVAAATNGENITFSLPAGSTIVLTSGAISVGQSVNILGPGAGSLAISGNGTNQAFSISADTLISGLTVTNGSPSAAAIYNYEAALTLSNVTVSGNPGGGIYGSGGSLALAGCLVSGNTNSGITAINENVELNDSSIAGNSGPYGGGLCLAIEVLSNYTLSVTNCVITGNSAILGGGMYLGTPETIATRLSNVVISSNSAASGGGVFLSTGAGYALDNVIISDNAATGPATNGAGNGGGGIYVAHTSLSLVNAQLLRNSAAGEGGGIYNDGDSDGSASVIVSNSVVAGNSAGSGGGLFSVGNQTGAFASLYYSTFSGNHAVQTGGAILCLADESDCTLAVVASTFNNNTAAQGGAIYNEAAEVITSGSMTVGITNSTLSLNSAVQGGAIFNISRPTNDVPLANTINLKVFNSTFSGNAASNGSVLFNVNSPGSISLAQFGSSILDAGTFGGTISNSAGQIVSAGFNLSSDNAGGALTNGTDLLNTAPLLGPLQNNGGPVLTQAPLAGSPAIDRGYNFSKLANDARGPGFARIYDYPYLANAPGGDGTDIGALELQVPLDVLFAQWQLQYFGCTNCPQAMSSADPDGDGLDNTAEFLAGTNPTNSASALRLISIKPQGNDLLLVWQTAGGRANVVQSLTSLAQGSFSDLSTNILTSGSGDATASYVVRGGATNHANSFYRVRLVQ